MSDTRDMDRPMDHPHTTTEPMRTNPEATAEARAAGDKQQNRATGQVEMWPDMGEFHERFEHIQGKNRGAYHAKRAKARGYVFREIDRNAHVDDIHAINTSLAAPVVSPPALAIVSLKYIGRSTTIGRSDVTLIDICVFEGGTIVPRCKGATANDCVGHADWPACPHEPV